MFQKTPTLVNLLNYDYKSDICFQQPFNVKYPICVISMFSERYISVYLSHILNIMINYVNGCTVSIDDLTRLRKREM